MKAKKILDGEHIVVGGKQYDVASMVMVGVNLEGSYESGYQMEILFHDKKTENWFLFNEEGGYMQFGDIAMCPHESAEAWLDKHGCGDDDMWTETVHIITNRNDKS